MQLTSGRAAQRRRSEQPQPPRPDLETSRPGSRGLPSLARDVVALYAPAFRLPSEFLQGLAHSEQQISR
jgi:hypothetical protein